MKAQTQEFNNMKYIFYLLTIIFSTNLNAQEINFGAKGGLNLSTVTGDVAKNTNPRLAYHFGVFVDIPLSERFSVHPELLYFSIGNTFNFSTENFRNFDLDPNVNSSFKSVQRANFLAVPINFRFNFTDKFGIDIGPQVSFLLNSVGKIKQSNNVNDVPEKTTNSGSFRPDYGANIGLAFSPNEKINIQLRYYQGLKNLINIGFFPEARSFNVALQVSVGYVIF